MNKLTVELIGEETNEIEITKMSATERQEIRDLWLQRRGREWYDVIKEEDGEYIYYLGEDGYEREYLPESLQGL